MIWTIARLVALVALIAAARHVLWYGILGNIVHRRRQSEQSP